MRSWRQGNLREHGKTQQHQAWPVQGIATATTRDLKTSREPSNPEWGELGRPAEGETGHGTLEGHGMGVCMTVCTYGGRVTLPSSWGELTWFLLTQLEKTQIWFLHGQKPLLVGVWWPRSSSLSCRQLSRFLASGGVWAFVLESSRDLGAACRVGSAMDSPTEVHLYQCTWYG